MIDRLICTTVVSYRNFRRFVARRMGLSLIDGFKASSMPTKLGAAPTLVMTVVVDELMLVIVFRSV